MDTELSQVKKELSKLKGHTVFTISRPRPNVIEDVSEERGFNVRARANPSWVHWDEVLRIYETLRKDGTVPPNNSKRSRGAFVFAVLATLTTVKAYPEPKKLRYVPEGKPPKLRI